jgi:hypothetical protein
LERFQFPLEGLKFPLERREDLRRLRHPDIVQTT